LWRHPVRISAGLSFTLTEVFFLSLCPLKVNRRFGGAYRFHLHGRGISREKTNLKQVASRSMLAMSLSYSWTPKMEVTCSSETLVEFQLTLQHYVQEDENLHSHCYENLRSSTSVPSHHSLQSSYLSTL
jgi:hypothetical protein